jgi:alkanesulfonate monooxygenase SsuD/methylene tetrahydromethanopterin reductase-like flavin-dependent oxidoreductase (luciferase family)
MQRRMAMHSDNALKIGLFGMNCSSGRAVTRVPERWSGSWADNLALARMADAAGIDFLLPIARWKGYGGDTDYEGETLETFTWATGLLASTERITVFATVHAPLFNPVMAAKALVTADHVGQGRAGLNVVVGWNEDEFAMFGVTQREHEARYRYAQEWLDAVKRMWSDETAFDIDGEFINLSDVRAKPKPVGGARPLIMNAGASATGRAYAIRNSDAFFTNASRTSVEETASVVQAAKDEAQAQGRMLDVYTVGVVTCRPTQTEAEAYYRYAVVDNADWSAVDAILAKRNMRKDNTPPEVFETARRHYATGMGGLVITGDPDQVANKLADMARAGLRGVALSFVNYLDELPSFCAEVLPRLQRLGLRASGKTIRQDRPALSG